MSEPEKKGAVVLLSGGMDSSVVLAMALDRGFAVWALTVSYGQRHAVEVEAARRVARAQGVERHRVVELDPSLFGGSALTTDLEVPKGPRSPNADPIPVTYVPARNTVFLSLALSCAEAIGARDIFIGVSSVDYSGYPDCRPAFIESFERTANLGTRAADGAGHFRIHAPLMNLTKAQTVEAGIALGVDFGLTHSCYDPAADGTPCGECDACSLRRRGFDEANVADPVSGRKGPK
jgi:7-cyano-7-deazaguanine synthase